MRASGVRPSCLARCAVITTTPAAPSLRPEALPAVTDPALSKARQRLGAGLLVDELVGGEDDRIALLLRDRERHDLVLEAAAFLGRGRLLLRSQRERIL